MPERALVGQRADAQGVLGSARFALRPRMTRKGMLYREAGQYKTSYAADMAVFPLRQDRWGIAVILAIAFVAIPLLANDFVLGTVMLPFLVFSLAAIGLNILTGYTGLISLGTAGFMGVGAIACYKLTTYFPQHQHHRLDPRLRPVLGRDRRPVRPALAAHQGLLPRGRDARRAVLPPVVLHPHPLDLQLQPLRRDRDADPHPVRRADHRRHRGDRGALPRGADDRRRSSPGSPRTSSTAASAGCGWRCATWTSRPS